MITKLLKKEFLIPFVLLLVLVGVFLAYYFYILTPKKINVQNMKTQLGQEEALLTQLENQTEVQEQRVIRSTRGLQERLPVEPILEQFLLHLEKAEVMSSSFITSMNFGEQKVDRKNLEADLNNLIAEKVNKQEALSHLNATEAGEPSKLPEGIERLTITLSVQSPDYFAMRSFLSALEGLTRIVKVDSLSFSGPGESIALNQDSQQLSYSVVISTFFLPTLEELKNQLPPFETPDPSGKHYPFAISGKLSKDENTQKIEDVEGEGSNEEVDITNDKLSNDQTKSQDEKNNEQQPAFIFISHSVKDNETIFSISMKYYKSKAGMEAIRLYNNIEDNFIFVGQDLKIPMPLPDQFKKNDENH